MKGFSVFSALIGTIIFIIAIVVVTLFVRTDMILKTNTVSGEYANQLEGVAGVVNAVFQATIIDVGEKTIEYVLEHDFRNSSLTIVSCSDKNSCYENIKNMMYQKFNEGLYDSKGEISTRIINIVLGKANSESIKPFKECFDLELDPESNTIQVITKGTANLSIDIGGVHKKYEFKVVANDFDTEYNFSVLKDVANVIGTIFENTPLDENIITATCSCLYSCVKCDCCHYNNKGKCTSYKHKPVPCLSVDNITKKDLFFDNIYKTQNIYENIKKKLEEKGFNVYDKEKLEEVRRKVESTLNYLYGVKKDINKANCDTNGNPDQICEKVGILSCSLSGCKKVKDKYDVIDHIESLEQDLSNLKQNLENSDKEIFCFDGSYLNDQSKLIEFLKNNKDFKYISKLKFCYIKRDNSNNVQNNQNINYLYNNIPSTNVGECKDITDYYNNDKFKEDIKEYLKKSLGDIIYNDNIDISIESDSSVGEAYCDSSGCACNCYCNVKGQTNRYYKIKEIEITLPIKICKIHKLDDCKIIYIKFIKS